MAANAGAWPASLKGEAGAEPIPGLRRRWPRLHDGQGSVPSAESSAPRHQRQRIGRGRSLGRAGRLGPRTESAQGRGDVMREPGGKAGGRTAGGGINGLGAVVEPDAEREASIAARRVRARAASNGAGSPTTTACSKRPGRARVRGKTAGRGSTGRALPSGAGQIQRAWSGPPTGWRGSEPGQLRRASSPGMRSRT